MTRSDRISAIFFIVLSFFICQQSMVFGLGTLGTPGSGMLSFCAGAIIGLTAFWTLIRSFFSKEPIDHAETEGKFRWAKFWVVCVYLFGYAIVMNWLGFVLSTFVVVFLLFHILDSEKGWFVAFKSALIAAASHLFFVEWLGLMPPKGFLGW